MDTAPRLIGPRYLTRFRCLGAECEDVCCVGWAVPVDPEHLVMLRRRSEESESARALLERAIVDVPEDQRRHEGVVALMRLTLDGRCNMLEPSGLCALQGELGEEAIPDTCALYPRYVGQVGDRLEVSATPSCPEIARLSLLAADGTDLVPLPPTALPRLSGTKRASPLSADLYERRFDDVRGTVLGLLQGRQVPLASRLFFLAYLAQETNGFLHRGAVGVDEGLLDQKLGLIERPDLQAQLHQQLTAIEVRDPFAATVTVELILSCFGRGGPTAYRRVVESCLGTYRGHPAEPFVVDEAGKVRLVPANLFVAWQERRPLVHARFGERLDGYLEGFARDFWFRDWYLKSATFLDHTMGFLARLAALRLLIASHPLTRQAMGLEDPAAATALLDRAAVEVVYTFTRTIDHHESLIEGLLGTLRQGAMNTLAHAVALITF